jgi:hypothetical protein
MGEARGERDFLLRIRRIKGGFLNQYFINTINPGHRPKPEKQTII